MESEDRKGFYIYATEFDENHFYLVLKDELKKWLPEGGVEIVANNVFEEIKEKTNMHLFIHGGDYELALAKRMYDTVDMNEWRKWGGKKLLLVKIIEEKDG